MAALASASSTDASSSGVDIDLTLSDPPYPDNQMGSSAEKPIELDLDAMDIDMAMSDLFGDSVDSATDDNGGVEGLFSPVIGAGDNSSGKEEDSFLNTLEGDANNEDIFASLNSSNDSTGPASQGGHNLSVPLGSSALTAPSPGTLLANFASATDDAATSGNPLPGGPPFDLEGLDIQNFLTDDNQMNLVMDEFLSMEPENQE